MRDRRDSIQPAGRCRRLDAGGPRNDSGRLVEIMKASSSVATTMIGVSAFGST